jgi:hypothetical protein
MLKYLMSMDHVLFAYLSECVGTLLNRAEHGQRMRSIESDA